MAPSADDKSTATTIGLVGGAAGRCHRRGGGAATAGPVGAAVGGIGAVAGAAGGKALVDTGSGLRPMTMRIGPMPTFGSSLYRPGTPYEYYRPAFEHGWLGWSATPARMREAESRLAEDWLRLPGRNMAWGRRTSGRTGCLGRRAALRRTAARRRRGALRPRRGFDRYPQPRW